MSPVTGRRRLERQAAPTPTPTSDPERTAARPNMGPLTTGFKAPEHCTRAALACPTCTNAFLGRSCKADATGVFTPEDDAACWPTATAWPRSGHQPFAGFGIYSPAVQCPTGYTSACGAIQTKSSSNDFKFQFPLEAGEEAIGCCPQGYECAMHENVGWQTCRQIVTNTKIEAFECGPGGSSSVIEAFEIPFTRAAATMTVMSLWAPMLQIVHQATDLPQSAVSNSTQTVSSASASATALLGKGGDSEKKETGMTTGAAVGIAVSPIIIAIIGALIFLFFWRRRRNVPIQQPDQRALDAAAAVPPPPPPGGAAAGSRGLGSSKASFRSNDTDSTKVPSINGSPTPEKPSPAPTHTPIYEEQMKIRRDTIDPFFLADHERAHKPNDDGYFDPWHGSEPAPPVPAVPRDVFDYERGQYTSADPTPMPPMPAGSLVPAPLNPYHYERDSYANVQSNSLSNEPGNEPGPTIRNNNQNNSNPYEGYGYGEPYPPSPEMFPAPPGVRKHTPGYDSPIDGSSPFRLKRGDTGDSIRRMSSASADDIGTYVPPRAQWASDEKTPRQSHESTWPTTLNKIDSFSRPRPPGSYTPPQRHSPPIFPAPVGSLSPATNYSPEPPEHEWKNPMRRADSFSRPRPRNLTSPSPSPPMPTQSFDGDLADARVMYPDTNAKGK